MSHQRKANPGKPLPPGYELKQDGEMWTGFFEGVAICSKKIRSNVLTYVNRHYLERKSWDRKT